MLLHRTHERLGHAGQAQVGGDMQGLTDRGCLVAAARGDDPRPFGREEAGRLQADASGRAGDDGDGVAQPEIHAG